MRRLIAPSAALLLPLLAACARPATQTTAAPQGSARAATHDRAALAAQLGLLAADRALAATTARSGLREGLASRFTDDVALLLPDAPAFTGADAARRLLAGEAGERRISWIPLHVEVSADSSFGISYGVALTGDTAAFPPRHGKYIAAWRRGPEGWRVVAFNATGVMPVPSPQTVAAAGLTHPSAPTSGPGVAFADADRAFAADAGRRGAATAFAAFVAPDGVSFPAGGDMTIGPVELEARLADFSAQTAWEWAPVVAGGAASGDLGFTVGESTIRPRPGAPGETSYGKYLTLWRRLPDGRVAFVADAGSARPAPAR